MNITNLRISHKNAAIAIDQNPYFSWILESNEDSTYQSTYQIIVKNEAKEIMWDSQEIASDKNDYISYNGLPLQNCTKYIWSVQIKDNHGNTEQAFSYFKTAFFHPPFEGTGAKWISDKNPVIKRAVGFGNQPAATVFKKKMYLKENIQNAELYITSHGAYEFTVNQKKVTNRKLATEYSSFDKILFYQNYDVTSALVTGENELEVTVGDGWYCSLKNMMDVNFENKYHALLFALKINYKSGKTEWISSDESTLCTTGAILSSDLYGGEIYDARNEINTDTKWNPCVSRFFSMETLKAQISD